MKTYTLEYIFEEIEEGLEELGVMAISLVGNPAHKGEFVAMSEGQEIKMSAVDEEKRMVIGPVIMPGDIKGTPLKGSKGRFSKDTISKLIENFAKNGRNSKTTLSHGDTVEGCYLAKSWQVDRTNGINAGYGFDTGENKVPDGTWMGAMKIEPDDIWMDCKKGDFNGFSIEGKLDTKQVAMSNYDHEIEQVEKLQLELSKEI